MFFNLYYIFCVIIHLYRLYCFFAAMLFSSPQFVCFSATWNCMLFCNIYYCMLLCNIFVIFVVFYSNFTMDQWYSIFLLYKNINNSWKCYLKKMKSICNILYCMLLCNMSLIFYSISYIFHHGPLIFFIFDLKR